MEADHPLKTSCARKHTRNVLAQPDHPRYVPTEWVCIILVALFGVSTAIHTVQAIWYRMWWLFPTVILAGCGEVIGWTGRLWSSLNIPNQQPFMMQIVATILAPTPLLAAIFIIFGRITQRLGARYSRLSPRLYSRIFLTCDIIALIIQGAGGGIAAGANNNTNQANSGANIMLAGIVFQLSALLAFVSLAVEFYIRLLKDRPLRTDGFKGDGSEMTVSDTTIFTPRLKLMTVGLATSTFFILIRSVYRTAELGDGWTGKILRTQVYFSIFDGAMIVVAIYAVNVFHPGFLMEVKRDSSYAFNPCSQLRLIRRPNGIERLQLYHLRTVAATIHDGIGQNARLPWRLPQEMAYFARVTSNAPEGHINAVVMGRNTWESIPAKFRPLPRRVNVVISRNEHYDASASVPANSKAFLRQYTNLNSALVHLSTYTTETTAIHRAFIIGGASLYRDTLLLPPTSPAFVDRILLTRILSPAFEECDVFMPNFRDEKLAEGHGPWKRESHDKLKEWVGFDVPEGIQEEKGVQYEFQMWTRLLQPSFAMPTHTTASKVTHLGGKWAIVLFAFVLLAFVIESQFTQYVQTNLGFRQPYFVFYVVHCSFSIMFPLHLIYLAVFSKQSLRPVWAGLLHALKEHIAATRFDKMSAFPTWGFLRLAIILSVAMSVPALLWFVAVTLAPLADVTALWNTNAFFAYILTVKLFKLSWEPHRLAAVVIATIGAAAVVYGGSSATPTKDKITTRDAQNSPNPFLGDMLTLIASVVYGIYQVLYKMYAALPSDPDPDLDRLPIDPSYEPIMDTDREDLEAHSIDKSDIVYPPPFALYANFLTTCIGLCTFFLLWIPIPILHFTGAEEFHLPPDATTWGVIAAISLSGVIFNAGLMVLLGLWGPIVTSVGNLLTIVLVFISDIIFGGAAETITVWSLLGSASIVLAFGVLAWDMARGHRIAGPSM
ncbi:hypothetical protein NM688_g698 [Phlebia brevispora]|uniref:Uncharacterized protein n=1 Tax=Phlebia brevispora TaxID=194682 RepID=A0ACC1TDX6_9APHY|nr:hypothetical protein NM688_g698 [Phlebia brevispora]